MPITMSAPTRLINPTLSERSGYFIAEASELNLAPGQTAMGIEVTFNSNTSFYLLAEIVRSDYGEVKYWIYKTDNPIAPKLKVFND